VLSCLVLAATVREPVTTIEGITPEDGSLHPMQQAFLDHDAYQCGYCTPGQIMSAVACVREGRAGSVGLPGLFEWLPADARTTLVAEDWEAPFDLVVENQLDHLHLHAVHPDTVGRGVVPTAPVKILPEEDHVRVWFSDSTDARSAFAEYRFPALWGTKVGTMLALTIGFAPISATRTRLYLQGHRGFARAPGLAALVDQGIRWFHRKVLSQDRPIVESQVHAPRAADRLFRSDAAIRWFRDEALTAFDLGAAHALEVNRSDLQALLMLEHGPRPTRDLSQALGLSSGATTALIDRLERVGLVQRSASESDRRVTLVGLSGPAFRRIGGLYAGLFRAFVGSVETAPARNIEAATQVLRVLATTCQEAATLAREGR
jgi:hypothetical protein